jgi:CheY-like chemotaxis protein/nitrogen-specific signal transduction histidine kinase
MPPDVILNALVVVKEWEDEGMKSAKQDEMQEFFYLCHDIKTPLATIMGMASITWAELDDREKVKDRLDTIETASSYLLSMINDILDYSKIVNGKMHLRKETFSLVKSVDFLKKLLVSSLQKKHQTFEIKLKHVYQDSLIGDSLRIKQILTNLLTNSIKYTGEGGKIILEFIQHPKSENSLILEMRVSDTGIGMSEEFMKRMFEPFAHAGDDNEVSTGLGLCITKHLVDLMNGEIQAASKPDKGTTFTVRIPLDLPPYQQDLSNNSDSNSQSNKTVAEHLKEYDFRGKCVLIAEDNKDMLEITTTMLKHSGISILAVENGIKALEYFRNSAPGSIDMILVDVYMPVMNGLETAAEIRNSDHPDAHQVAIFAVTASDNEEDEANALRCGINEYIKKPIDNYHLFNLMNRYLTKEN